MGSKMNTINKIMIQKYFFTKWKKGTDIESSLIIGVNPLQNILRRYFIRYLLMNAKLIKFRTLLVKYALLKQKHK